jgi:hypothetical protein
MKQNSVTQVNGIPVPHLVSELICVRCGGRWVSARPSMVLLRNLTCPVCNRVGFVIETGQQMDKAENVP